MSKEIKTAEEFVREKIRDKNQFPPKYQMEGLQNYSVNGEECLRWAHEFMEYRLKAQEEKHKEEMEKLAEWTNDNFFYSTQMNKWAYRFELGKYCTTTELIEMFKKSK